MRAKLQYECQSCGARTLKWSGRCAECGQWNSLVESIVRVGKRRALNTGSYGGGRTNILRLDDIGLEDEPRRRTGISELDRVLGGGFVAGSVVLIGG